MKCYTVQKDILILKCNCMLCKNCLKTELLSLNKDLMMNELEADYKREGVCVCPNHYWSIPPKILAELFSPQELEVYSVEAMKRRIIKTKKDRNKYPNICIGCKSILQDNIKNWTNLCYRHKLCRKCSE